MEKPSKVVLLTDKGTQACIDHIARKIIAFQRVNPDKPDNATLAMLKNIKVELEQYL